MSSKRQSGAQIGSGIHAVDIAAEPYSASDEAEWLNYLRQALRAHRKPGVSLKEEHGLWLAARARTRALASAASEKAS